MVTYSYIFLLFLRCPTFEEPSIVEIGKLFEPFISTFQCMRRYGSDPYEHRVERYEDWFEKNEPAYRSELLAVEALLPSGGKGIEVGVGTGRFAASMVIIGEEQPSDKVLACGDSAPPTAALASMVVLPPVMAGRLESRVMVQVPLSGS